MKSIIKKTTEWILVLSMIVIAGSIDSIVDVALKAVGL